MSTLVQQDVTAAAGEILRISGLSKTFDGSRALDDVDLDVRAGEVHALVGHNGSGKSTLIKVLSGFHDPDPGMETQLDGKTSSLSELTRAHDQAGARLGFVHQDLGLVLELNAIDNLALRGGFVTTRTGRVRWREQAAATDRLMRSLGVDFDVSLPLARATPVERTTVAIAAALQTWDRTRGVLVLDEPTAVLPPGEARRLQQIVRELRAGGAGIVYVSHRLDEVLELADRVTVLRNGRKIITRDVAGLSKADLVHLMLGEEMDPDYRAAIPEQPSTEAVLEVEGLRGQLLRDATFTVHRGEVVGVAGLPDSGRNELPRLLTDQAGSAAHGRARVGGAGGQWGEVRHGLGDRVVLLPPDRGTEGVIAPMSVKENLSLSVLADYGHPGALAQRRERSAVRRWIDRLGVRAASMDTPIRALSGGNQQKVLLGRVLARNPQVLVLCEPTAGVDIGARHAIYDLVASYTREGLAAVVASSDVGDLVALCTRVLVLGHDGVSRELAGDELTEHQLIRAMEDVEEEVPR